MAIEITQSQTSEPIVFLMIDSALHIAGKTGLSPTVTISKNGGAFGAPAGSVTELANGWYKIAGNATDADTLGPLLVHAEATGADPVDDRYQVVKQNRRTSSMDLVLAKTTNLTGLNDIAATSIVSSGAITTAGGKAAATVAAGDLASGAITAAVFAANAINAAALATDAVNEIINGLLDAVNTAALHNVANSVGRQIRTGGGTATGTIYTGTAQTGSTSNTIKLPAGASATNNIYNGATIVLTGGVGVGQTRRIVAYLGTTKIATVDKTWITIPTNTTTFDIIAGNTSIVAFEGVAAGGGNDYVTLPSSAVATDGYYSGFVVIESGTGSGQSKEITGYTGSTRQVSIASDTWAVNPSTDSVVAIMPQGDVTVDTNVNVPSADEIATAIGTRIAEIQGNYTYDQILSIVLAALAGVTADLGATLKTPNGLATRIAATVNASNERTGMTLTP